MPFPKGKRNPKAGRRKGTPNKTTAEAKAVIAEAAAALGGAKRLLEWAKSDPKNEATFWASIYPKLVPHEVTGAGGGPLVAALPTIYLPDNGRGSSN